MEQKSFNTIQNNFKKFLGNKLYPIKEEKEISPTIPNLNQKIERIERTTAFGREDAEIGYKISFNDPKGNRKTEIVPIHSPNILEEDITELTSEIIPDSHGFDIIAYHNGEEVGKLQVAYGHQPNTSIISAADVNEKLQRQGIGTFLHQQLKIELKNKNIKFIKASLEGSGMVQIWEKVFGKGNTHYFSGEKEVTPEEAIHIMDVDFGYLFGKAEIT